MEHDNFLSFFVFSKKECSGYLRQVGKFILVLSQNISIMFCSDVEVIAIKPGGLG